MTTGPQYINPWSLFVGCFLPNWLLERPELSLGAKVTYARLAQFAGRKGVAVVRQEVLAEKLAVSERSVSNYLGELAEHELIESHRPGLGRPNQHRFLRHAWMQFRDDLDEEDIPDPQDLQIQSRKICGSGSADVADPDQQGLPARSAKIADPSNDKNQRREKDGAAAPNGSDDPSLFEAQGLPDGSPGGLGSPSLHGAAPPPPSASQNGHAGRKAETAEIVRRVFGVWQQDTDSPRAKLTDARRSKITARLREGYTPEQLICVVTDGWRADPWPGRIDNNDLVILLRDGPQVEKFLKLAGKARHAGSGNGNGHHADPEEELRLAREHNDRERQRMLAARGLDQPQPQRAAS